MAAKEVKTIIEIFVRRDCAGIVMLYVDPPIYTKLKGLIKLVYDLDVPMEMIYRMPWIKKYDDVILDGGVYLLGQENRESMKEYIEGWRDVMYARTQTMPDPHQKQIIHLNAVHDQRRFYLYKNWNKKKKIAKGRCSSDEYCRKLFYTFDLVWLEREGYPYMESGNRYIYCI